MQTYSSLAEAIQTLLELRKYILALLKWNSRTGIFNINMHVIVDHFCLETNESFVNKFDTISTQVETDLFQAQSVRHNNESLWTIDQNFELGVSLWQHCLNWLQDIMEDICRRHVDLELLVSCTMHIQHISQQIVNKS